LPTPARAAIEANPGDKRRRGKREEAAIMESMETSECKPVMETSDRKPIDARCKSWPEREAAGADESTAESGTSEPSAYRRAAETAANRHAAETAAYRRAAETAAHHSAAKATTHPAVKAPSVEAATHPGIGRGRRCHRAREGDSGQRDYDLTHHGVSSICREEHRVSLIVVEFRPLMVRKRAALLGLYNVPVTARSLRSLPVELVFDAGRCRREERSQQRTRTE